MSGKSALGDVVHLAAADLHFDPVAVGSHDGDVEGTIFVHLGRGEPVTHAVGMLSIDLGDLVVDVPADAFLGALVVALKDDACGVKVIHLLKGDVLVLHLVPYRVARLDAREELVLEPHVVESLPNGCREAGEEFVAALLAGGNLVFDALVFGGMVVLEAQVLQFGLDGIQTQAVCQRSVDVKRLAGNLVLLVGGHRREGAHVVQAVGHLDEHHADVLAHGEQQFAEVLGLQRSLVAEDAARDLGETVHDACYLGAELCFDILDGVVGVLDYVVQQSGADAGGTQSYFLADDGRHRQRMHDVRFS